MITFQNFDIINWSTSYSKIQCNYTKMRETALR